ncbi:MAG: sigma-70 family RNA polymerase sigma factor [Lapillicoccus sp.]
MHDEDLATREPVDESYRPTPGQTEDDVAALRAPLSRYVMSRVRDPHRAEDIVQETLLRMLQVRERMELETLSAYAFTVARNLVHSSARSDVTARTHLSRLHDPQEPERPEQAVASAETRRALASAIAQLTPGGRALFVAHEVEERPLAELAALRAVAPGTLASQLHRTRARLRVDYLLSLRRVTLPTRTCRPVLMAVSAGDRRAQASLDAGEHLAHCRVCGDLAPPLTQRDRALAGLVPFVPLGALQGGFERFLRSHPATGPAAAAVVAASVVGASALGWQASHPLAPEGVPPTPLAVASTSEATTTPPVVPSAQPVSAAPTAATATSSPAGVPGLTASGRTVIGDTSHLAPLVGAGFDADHVHVVAVPADEGFWVGTDGPDHASGDQVWVQLTGAGESPVTVRAGQSLDFTGVVVANAPGFVDRLTISDQQGRSALSAAGYHLEAKASSLVVR